MAGEWWNILDALKTLRRPVIKTYNLQPIERTVALAADRPRESESHDEFGASGTESYAGILQVDEYNPVLRWPNAVQVYEEMRKSSPHVIASLRVLKLPILRATFEIRPPKDADTQDRAIADFVTWALLRTGAMRDAWSNVLRHLLLMFDFGFSATELVWNVALFDSKPVYNFWRLAPRLPKTLEGWKVSDNGELQQMIQYAPKGPNGEWRSLPIPADYLCVVVHEREADNFNGLSVLRGAYKPWYYQNQLEHIDMIRHHRFSAGIPEAKLKEQTKLTRDERATTIDTLTALASNEAAFIITPSKMDFNIHFPTGGDSGIGKSIEYHTHGISASILAQFLTNAAEGLNTNRTRTLADLFKDLLQATADGMAGDVGRQIIVRLCDQNFDMTGREYPTGVFTNINPVNMQEVSAIFKELGAGGFVTPDDDLEVWLRNITGAPPMQAGVERQRQPAAAIPAGGAEGDVQPGRQPDDANTEDPIAAREREDSILSQADRIAHASAMGTRVITARDGQVLAAATIIRQHRTNTDTVRFIDQYVEHERVYGRRPTDLERQLMALAEIPDKLDTTTDAFTAALVKMRKAQLERAAKWFGKRASLTGVKPDDIPMQDAGDAYALIRETQDDLDGFGAQQVRHELMKQGAPASLFLSEHGMSLASRKDLADALVASARSFADWMNTEWRSDLLDAAVRLFRTGLVGDELESELTKLMDGRAEQGVLRFAKQKINEAYGVGRAREADKHSDEIARVVQSAILDRNTCRPCQAVDGEEMPYGSKRQKELAPPYRRCLGADNCRCSQLFIYENPRDRAGEGTRLRDNRPAVH